MLFKQSWTLNNNLVLKVNGEIKQKNLKQISFKLGGEQSGEGCTHPSFQCVGSRGQRRKSWRSYLKNAKNSQQQQQ